ncbi:MAG: hypothetical protein AAFV53_00860 [Myxococcota bacterium]
MFETITVTLVGLQANRLEDGRSSFIIYSTRGRVAPSRRRQFALLRLGDLVGLNSPIIADKITVEATEGIVAGDQNVIVGA